MKNDRQKLSTMIREFGEFDIQGLISIEKCFGEIKAHIGTHVFLEMFSCYTIESRDCDKYPYEFSIEIESGKVFCLSETRDG